MCHFFELNHPSLLFLLVAGFGRLQKDTGNLGGLVSANIERGGTSEHRDIELAVQEAPPPINEQ